MQEEGGVISGLLVGLNIIDCNFDLKGDSLDVWVSEEKRSECLAVDNSKEFMHRQQQWQQGCHSRRQVHVICDIKELLLFQIV